MLRTTCLVISLSLWQKS